MVRKILIALAALAAVTAAPTVDASARGMGMGHGGMCMSHMSFAHSASFAGVRSFSGARPMAFTGNHVAFNHLNHFPFRHHFRNRLFLVGGFPYAYSYYDDGCWTRVWTPWGWRWRSLCY